MPVINDKSNQFWNLDCGALYGILTFRGLSQKHFGSSFIVSEPNSVPGSAGFQLGCLNDLRSKEVTVPCSLCNFRQQSEHFALGATHIPTAIFRAAYEQKYVTFSELGENCSCKQVIKGTNMTRMLKYNKCTPTSWIFSSYSVRTFLRLFVYALRVFFKYKVYSDAWNNVAKKMRPFISQNMKL